MLFKDTEFMVFYYSSFRKLMALSLAPQSPLTQHADLTGHTGLLRNLEPGVAMWPKLVWEILQRRT